MSTIAASTAYIQVLSAPTRDEADVAHAQRKYLHIGVFGVNNLRSIQQKRWIIIIVLFVSSVPLHLLVSSYARSLRDSIPQMAYESAD